MIAKVQLEDGRIARFEVPEGTTEEEVMAQAQSLIPGQEEAPKEEGGPGGFMPFLNKGMAQTLGAPVDLISAGLNAVGINTGDAPMGGSQSIRKGMSAIKAPTPDRGPQTTSEFMGAGVGEGAGMALPLGGAVNAVSKTSGVLGGLAKAGRNRLLKTAGPAKAAGLELGGGMGAGAAREQAERGGLGPTQTMLAEMAGGVAATASPGLALRMATKLPVLSGAKKVVQQFMTPFNKEASWQQASDEIRSLFDEPMDAVRQVKAAKGTNVMPATATENPGLLGIQQTVFDMDKALGQRMSKHASESVEKLSKDIVGSGNAKTTREFIKAKREGLFSAMTARVEIAASRANAALEVIGDSASAIDVQKVASKAMQEAEADVRLMRKALWDGADQTVKSPVKEQVAEYRRIVDSLYDVEYNNMPKKVRDIMNPIANVGYRGVGSSKTVERTVGESYALYQELGRLAKNFRSAGTDQNLYASANLTKLRAAIMKDIETQAGTFSDLRTAVDFSNMEINTFRKGAVGNLLGYGKGEAVPPTLTFDKTIKQKGEPANLMMQDIQRAAKAGDASSVTTNPKSPLIGEGVQDYVKQRFIREAVEDGVVNPAKARAYISGHEEILESFPTLKKQLEAARKQEDVLRRVTKETDGQRGRFDKESIGTTAHLLGGPLDVQIKKIMSSGDPTEAMGAAMKTVKGNKEALDGLRSGFGQYLATDITTSKQDSVGRLIMDGLKLRANLKTEKFMAPMRKLYTPQQIKLIEEMADQLAKFQIQQQHNKAAPLLRGVQSWLIDLTAGAVGAKFGRALNTGTIQVPGKSAALFNKAAKFLTTNKTKQLISDAMVDHDLMIALLRGKGTAKGERVLRSYLLGTGARLMEEDEEATPVQSRPGRIELAN